MLATIWMCTQEWSLISSRTTAFTFETCHQAFSCLSSLTRSIELAELAVAAHRQVDVHLLDRLRRGQARLAHRLLRDRLVDPLLGLVVEIHQVRTTTLRANLSWKVCRRRSRSGQRWSSTPGTVKSAQRNAVESQRLNARA